MFFWNSLAFLMIQLMLEMIKWTTLSSSLRKYLLFYKSLFECSLQSLLSMWCFVIVLHHFMLKKGRKDSESDEEQVKCITKFYHRSRGSSTSCTNVLACIIHGVTKWKQWNVKYMIIPFNHSWTLSANSNYLENLGEL